MEDFELTDERCLDVMEWMHNKGYSFNTIKQYRFTLKMLQRKYKVLNNDTLRKILKGFKHQNQRSVLCAVNNYCFDMGLDFRLVIPKLKGRPRKLPELYSVEEIKIMIESAPAPYDLALRCIFNLGAGLRVSEIIKLSWNHIRWADWIQNKDGYGVVLIKSSKGGKDRVVNIPRNLMWDLYTYAKKKDNLNEFGIPTGGMVFPMGATVFKPEMLRHDINKWKNEYLKHGYDWFRYNIMKCCCEKALGKKIKVHTLRHSRATYLHEVEKVPIERISQLLGHSDLSTTMIYTKVPSL